MNNMQIFENSQFGAIRTVIQDGEPWFALKDVCEAFGEKNYRRLSDRLDDDEKGVSQMNTPGGPQSMTIVNESGLYTLLFAMQPEMARGVSDEYIRKRQESSAPSSAGSPTRSSPPSGRPAATPPRAR